MDRVQIIAIITGFVLFLGIVELVRRRTLKEQYSILWITSSLVLLVLSFWRGLLDGLARWVGIFYPPSMIFLVAFIFLLLIVLHFSIVISRLTEQNKRLVQELGLLRLWMEDIKGETGKTKVRE